MRTMKKILARFTAVAALAAIIFPIAMPSLPAAAAEAGTEASGEPADEAMGALRQGEEKADNVTKAGISKMIGIIPYIGAVLFVAGTLVAVFSTRNKGNRRWGIRLAVTEAVITYVIYVALTLVSDFVYQKCPVRHAERPEHASGFEKIYFDTAERLSEEGQGYLFLEKGWAGNAAYAVRKAYAQSASLLAFTSISLGVLLLIVTRRDRTVKRLAVAGMIIAVPAVLLIGYHYLAVR